MERGKEITWLTGQQVIPWVKTVTFPITEKSPHITYKSDQMSANVGPAHITYKYSIHCDENDYSIWEREPSRYLEVQPPHEYRG